MKAPGQQNSRENQQVGGNEEGGPQESPEEESAGKAIDDSHAQKVQDNGNRQPRSCKEQEGDQKKSPNPIPVLQNLKPLILVIGRKHSMLNVAKFLRQKRLPD